MPSRRTFLLSSGLTAAMSRSAMGANDRIRMGVLGTGTRGSYMATVLAPNADCEIVAMCDVYKRNLDRAAAKLETKVETYSDYRRVLERKDIDAVFIATPDHWHGPLTIQACEAGKDVYVEKPVSNSIEVGWKMIEAAQKYKRVVQVGLQQRSWDHFQQCVQMVQDGKFGTIFHAGLHWNGHYTRPVEQPQEPPADLIGNCSRARRRMSLTRRGGRGVGAASTTTAGESSGRAHRRRRALGSGRARTPHRQRFGAVRHGQCPERDHRFLRDHLAV